MSFFDAFRKRRPEPESADQDPGQLTLSILQMDIKTLDQALGHIDELTSKIQGLESSLAESAGISAEYERCKNALGITKAENGDFECSSIDVLKASIADRTAEREQFAKELSTARARIDELEKDQKTVSAKAREFLAAQGGRALPVSGSGSPKPATRAQLTEAMDQANRAGNQEELKRLYAELKKNK